MLRVYWRLFLFATTAATFLIIPQLGHTEGSCAADRPCITGIWDTGNEIHVQWSGNGNYDNYNFRWSRPGRAETQSAHGGGSGGETSIKNAHSGVVYRVKVQGCNTRVLQSSQCSPWAEATYTIASGDPDACRAGFVWRDAFNGDHVCVTSSMRDRVATDNAQAAARRQPGGGPFGFDACRQGFVWREASPSDHVCVTPQMRDQVAADNAAAPSRRARP
jgi:hypothetical protein